MLRGLFFVLSFLAQVLDIFVGDIEVFKMGKRWYNIRERTEIVKINNNEKGKR